MPRVAGRDQVSAVLARRGRLFAAAGLAAAGIAALVGFSGQSRLVDAGEVMPPVGLPVLSLGVAALVSVFVLVGVAGGRARDLRPRAGWTLLLVIGALFWWWNNRGGVGAADAGAFWGFTVASATLSYVACVVAHDVAAVGA